MWPNHWTLPACLQQYFYNPWPLLIVLITIFIIQTLWSRRRLYLLSWRLHGPFAFPLVGNVDLLFRESPITSLRKIMTKAPNKLVRLWLGSELAILIGDPDVAYQVNKGFEKPDFYEYLGGLHLKDGLFMVSTKDRWRRARQIWRPVFTLKNIKSFLHVFHSESLTAVQSLQAMASTGESRFPMDMAEHYSFSSAIGNFFHASSLTQEECKSCENLLGLIFEHFQVRVFNPLSKNRFLYWLVGQRQKENECMRVLKVAANKVYGTSKRILEEENSLNTCPEDTSHRGDSEETSVHALLRQIPGNVPDVTLDELLTQGGTMVGASVDTVKKQNMSLLLMLALNHDVQNKLYKELTEKLGEDVTQIPSYEDILGLDYLDRFIKECLRMIPAGPLIAKKFRQDMKITVKNEEYNIPAGVTMVIFILAIQNDPDYYPNPDQFDPDRWLPELSTQRHPHCYLPFSSGPRHCIGKRYGLLQMKVLLASIVRTFEILPSPECRTMEDLRFNFVATLAVKDDCYIRLRRRGPMEYNDKSRAMG